MDGVINAFPKGTGNYLAQIRTNILLVIDYFDQLSCSQSVIWAQPIKQAKRFFLKLIDGHLPGEPGHRISGPYWEYLKPPRPSCRGFPVADRAQGKGRSLKNRGELFCQLPGSKK